MLVAITLGMKPARLASAWNTVVSAGYCTRKRMSGFAFCRRCTSDASVVAPVLVVRSATILKPPVLGEVGGDLPVVLAEEVVAREQRDRPEAGGPAVVRPLLQELKTLATIVLSFGPVRQNHLKPFSVSVGDAQA